MEEFSKAVQQCRLQVKLAVMASLNEEFSNIEMQMTCIHAIQV